MGGARLQADHISDLMAGTDCPAFDLDLTRAHVKKWEHDKEEVSSPPGVSP